MFEIIHAGSMVLTISKKYPEKIYLWNILQIIVRNRRVSVTLSPTLTLFLAPHGKLYVKLQRVLEQLQACITNPSPILKERSSPPKPPNGIPVVEWPNVLRRVIENGESLRQVAADYGVSYETVRRTVRAAQKSQHRG
jgi:hypothetical protein